MDQRPGCGTAYPAEHVRDVKEDKSCSGVYAGFNGVAHDMRPHFLPEHVIVLETNGQMHNTGAGDGAEGLVLIREIGGEKFDEFVANGTARSEDGDHSDLAFRAYRRVRLPGFAASHLNANWLKANWKREPDLMHYRMTWRQKRYFGDSRDSGRIVAFSEVIAGPDLAEAVR